MVAVTGVVPVFMAVNAGISPAPLAPIPIPALVFVQLNTAPAVRLENEVAGTVAPLHTVISDGTLTAGDGFTVMLYAEGIPGQVLADGVTVMVADIGSGLVFVAVNPEISPEPPAPKPMAVFELAQLNVAPETRLVKLVADIEAPLHTEKSAGTFTVGVGFTVMV